MHEDGVVHVPGAVPGDVVRFRVTGRRHRAFQAELEAIETPSPDRRAPPCPLDAVCGGCDLSGLTPEARLRAMSDALGRTLSWKGVQIEPSPRSAEYRARIDLAIGPEGQLGYHPPRSNAILDVARCGIARPEVQQGLDRLRALPREALRGLERVEIRSDGARVVYSFEAAKGARPQGLEPLGDVAVDGRALHGDPTLWLTVHGLRLRASPRSFYQVNPEINALLIAHIVSLLADLKAERVLDLYAGIGNLSLPIAAGGRPVVAVELEGQAIGDLRASAQALKLPVEPIAMDVAKFDPSRVAFDVAVVDPPRAGSPGVLAKVVRNRPRALVLVSCNASAAARDLKEATAAGYVVDGVRGFDMFPDTHHTEAVITLRRGR